MKLAQRVFLIAGMYGILVTVPLFFMEESLGREFPPVITHPELFYGFACVTLAWQFAFLIISRDPERYRLIMLPAIFEKWSYAVAVIWLFVDGRIPAITLGFGLIDFCLGLLFLLSFAKTKGAGGSAA